jgi:hypothetical protein
MKRTVHYTLALLLLASIAVITWVRPTQAQAPQRIPQGFAASNFETVGYSEIDGRPAFKMAIREVNNRWYLYMGHLWHRGWTIMDVTDPAKPQVVKFVPGPENTWTIQVDLHDDIMITALEQVSRRWGGDPSKPHDEGFLIWDIKDPVNPKKLGQWKTGGRGTHRNGYPGGKYVYAAAALPGYSDELLVVVDISDPANPKEVSRFSAPGQHEAAGEKPEEGMQVHGPPMVEGNRMYLDYGGAGMYILDVSDITKPRAISHLDFRPPYTGGIVVHSVMPIPNRNLVWVNSEAIAEDCKEGMPLAALIDIKDEKNPTLISTMPIPAPPPGAKYADFCAKGARFGPHNINQLVHHPDVQKQGPLMYLTYFNAGLRVFDISNARLPKEVGYFIPPDPVKRYGPVPTTLVEQTEDVLVDRRGYVYVSNKNQGLWILRYTGPRPGATN